MQRTVAGALVAALALGVASCGGSSPLSKADFAKQVDAVCTRTQAKMNATLRVRQKSGFISALSTIAAEERQEAKDLEAIKPPSELKATYDQFRANVTARHDTIDQYAAAYRGARKNMRALEATASAGQRAAHRLAAQLGSKSCPTI